MGLNIIKKTAISAFILFHFGAIASWNFQPPASRLTNLLNTHLITYLHYLGVWQYWNMLTPSPLQMNAHIRMQVVLKDGTVTPYNLPRMDEMGFFARYFKYHWSKFMYNVHADGYGVIRREAARYAARKAFTDPSNPPVRVDYYRGTSVIPLPEVGLRDGYVPCYDDVFFDSYGIGPEDLEP